MKTLYLVCLLLSIPALAADGDVEKLMAAMTTHVDSPAQDRMIRNLASLTDEVGGRPTGSAANLAAVDWALARFAERGVNARKEPFPMPLRWAEQEVRAEVVGDIRFEIAVVAMPGSAATPIGGLRAPILHLGKGGEAEFAAAGDKLRGALALFDSKELENLTDLFAEYDEVAAIEKRARAAGVAGMLFTSSRPRNLLYRHNAVAGGTPMLIVEREAAGRIARLLEQGKHLELACTVELEARESFTSYNVVGEIKGTTKPEEIVLVGAHLDSWDLGTGALDNGCNVAMLIEIAARMVELGLKPQRTLRFCLFNGEEQGMFGSLGYTLSHEAELDQHVMALSIDIGSGKLEGFFVDGPPGFPEAHERLLKALAAYGPYQNLVAPVVGTDNFDFMLQGVANLVGLQDSANYGPNYHARSDTFDKVDQKQLIRNSAQVAALLWLYSEGERSWSRRSRAEVQTLIDTTDLAKQMDTWGYLEAWRQGRRGHK